MRRFLANKNRHTECALPRPAAAPLCRTATADVVRVVGEEDKVLVTAPERISPYVALDASIVVRRAREAYSGSCVRVSYPRSDYQENMRDMCGAAEEIRRPVTIESSQTAG